MMRKVDHLYGILDQATKMLVVSSTNVHYLCFKTSDLVLMNTLIL